MQDLKSSYNKESSIVTKFHLKLVELNFYSKLKEITKQSDISQTQENMNQNTKTISPFEVL